MDVAKEKLDVVLRLVAPLTRGIFIICPHSNLPHPRLSLPSSASSHVCWSKKHYLGRSFYDVSTMQQIRSSNQMMKYYTPKKDKTSRFPAGNDASSHKSLQANFFFFPKLSVFSSHYCWGQATLSCFTADQTLWFGWMVKMDFKYWIFWEAAPTEACFKFACFLIVYVGFHLSFLVRLSDAGRNAS